MVQNPGFNNPAYPADDYSLPNGSPGVGFVVFDPSQAGRSNPVINPPAVPATFPTKTLQSRDGFLAAFGRSLPFSVSSMTPPGPIPGDWLSVIRESGFRPVARLLGSWPKARVRTTPDISH